MLRQLLCAAVAAVHSAALHFLSWHRPTNHGWSQSRLRASFLLPTVKMAQRHPASVIGLSPLEFGLPKHSYITFVELWVSSAKVSPTVSKNDAKPASVCFGNLDNALRFHSSTPLARYPSCLTTFDAPYLKSISAVVS